MTALQMIQEGWRTGRLCECWLCGRISIHFRGEYGCLWSDVLVYEPLGDVAAMAEWTAERLGLPGAGA